MSKQLKLSVYVFHILFRSSLRSPNTFLLTYTFKDFVLLPLGVGPARNQKELQTIASNPKNVMEVEHLDNLGQIKESLLTRLCVESNFYQGNK